MARHFTMTELQADGLELEGEDGGMFGELDAADRAEAWALWDEITAALAEEPTR